MQLLSLHHIGPLSSFLVPSLSSRRMKHLRTCMACNRTWNLMEESMLHVVHTAKVVATKMMPLKKRQDVSTADSKRQESSMEFSEYIHLTYV